MISGNTTDKIVQNRKKNREEEDEEHKYRLLSDNRCFVLVLA